MLKNMIRKVIYYEDIANSSEVYCSCKEGNNTPQRPHPSQITYFSKPRVVNNHQCPGEYNVEIGCFPCAYCGRKLIINAALNPLKNEYAETALKILCGNHILVGREIEDCQYGKTYTRSDGQTLKKGEYHMIMVRPFTKENFAELFNHGAQYCSKFEIYGISDDFMTLIRPDQYNYDKKAFEFQLTENWDENTFIQEIEKERKADKHRDFNKNAENNFVYFVIGRLCNAVDIIDLGNGSYNIIIEM